MRFAVAASGLVAVASASWAPSYGPASNETTVAPVYTTEVVTSFTTYCPEATQLTHNGVTYTVSEATTLTITNCPCTVTKPVYSSVVSSCSTCSAAPASSAPASSAPVVAPTYPSSSSAVVAPTYPASTWSSSVVVVAPTYPATSAPMYPSANATVPVVAPTGTGVYTTKAPAYTGAASKTSFGAAGLLAALGLVAAL